MVVRESDGNDIEEILFVINESNRTYFRAIIPEEYFKDPVLSLDEIMGKLGRMTFFTYTLEERMVGVAALEETTRGSGQIHWVYVLPDYQRRGVGTALIAHVESEAKERDINELMVITAARADWARDFYVKLDYELVGTKDTPDGGVATYRKDVH